MRLSFELLLGGGSGSGFEASPYILMGVGLLLSVVTVHLIWRTLENRNANEEAQEHDSDGMVVCPECGEPTEAEYRFCRICAGDTGKSYVNSGGGDESNRSGMF